MKRKTKMNQPALRPVSEGNRLSERFMLVHLRTSQWTGRTRDENVCQYVQKSYESQSDAGDWFTALIAKEDLAGVNRTRMRVRQIYYKYTLPWMDGGLRILAAAMYLKYKEELRAAIQDHEKEVAAFLRNLPDIITRRKRRLGRLADGLPLPTAAELRNKFVIQEEIFAVPEAEDFRVQQILHVGADEVEEIRQQAMNSLQAVTGRAMADLWGQLRELVEKVASVLQEPDKVFRDTLLGNLKEFCELVPNLNLTNDPDLEQIRQEALQELASLKPATLRVDKRQRKAASTRARKLAARMKAMQQILQ